MGDLDTTSELKRELEIEIPKLTRSLTNLSSKLRAWALKVARNKHFQQVGAAFFLPRPDTPEKTDPLPILRP